MSLRLRSTHCKDVESDPIGLAGGSYSTYAYANGNPTSNIDPTGRFVPPVLELPGAAVTVSYYAGYGIGTLIYDVWGTQINDALEQVFPYPAAASGASAPAAGSAPPLPPAANDTDYGDRGCPPDCRALREALNGLYQAIQQAEVAKLPAAYIALQQQRFDNAVKRYEKECGPYTPPPSIHEIYTK